MNSFSFCWRLHGINKFIGFLLECCKKLFKFHSDYLQLFLPTFSTPVEMATRGAGSKSTTWVSYNIYFIKI
jgi:hypothetical protein